MLLPSLFRRSTPGVTGSEHPAASGVGLFAMMAAPAQPGSNSPLGELRLAESLDEFHALVRRHQIDRIYLDLLDLARGTGGTGTPACHVILSASKGGVDLLARLPGPNEKSAHGAPSVDPVTYRNVLRSRFLFLGYSVSEGLASARLARHLEGPATKSS